MHMHARTTHAHRLRRATFLVPVLALAPLALAACGSDDDSSTAATAAAAPSSDESSDDAADEEGEYEIVSDAEVATGLADTITTLGTLTADPSTATDEAVDEVFEGWERYEGTIKQNEVASYLDFEDALASFKDAAEAGDAAKMAAATETFSTAAAAYLTAHPG
jgi:hypothetical protein